MERYGRKGAQNRSILVPFRPFQFPPPQPSWQTASSNGDLEVGFWIEKIENFEIFWDRPISIGDGFGKCLGWFWRDSEPLVVIWECVAMLSICEKGLAQMWPVGAIIYIS